MDTDTWFSMSPTSSLSHAVVLFCDLVGECVCVCLCLCLCMSVCEFLYMCQYIYSPGTQGFSSGDIEELLENPCECSRERNHMSCLCLVKARVHGMIPTHEDHLLQPKW